VTIPPDRPTRPLRVCIASSGLGHVSRGIEAWAADLAAELARRGVVVILAKGAGRPETSYERVLPCWRRESRAARRLLAVVPRALAWRIGMAGAYGVEQTTFAFPLVRLLRRERIDILHVQDPQVALLVQRARQIGLVKTKTILAHGTEEPPEWLRKIEYVQHLAPWHLEAARDAGAWRDTWTAIPNFVDTDRFHPGRCPELRAELGIPGDAVVVLTVAAIKRKHKRIDYLLQEIGQVRATDPELPLWLVIAGGWEPETDALVREGAALLGDRVRFLVRFPRERMPDLYRAAVIFVLTSLFEMMPIALLEAMATSLPCIVHHHPLLTYMVGTGGKSIDMSISGALGGVVAAMASAPALRICLGRLGRSRCESTFEHTTVIGSILDYYARSLGDRRSAMPPPPAGQDEDEQLQEREHVRRPLAGDG
jgi:glycosyltransferase involved in cell wall biosynthesis